MPTGTPSIDRRRRLQQRPPHRRFRNRIVATSAGAVVVALGTMHLMLDGLSGVLLPLQPVVADRTGASPGALGLLVALALASSSLLQPLTAGLALRWGDGRAASAGALLAALGYGALPFTFSTAQAALAVVIGGLGSALFHPGAGAMVARAAQPGREALPLAVFSAVGTGGVALVPIAVLAGVDSFGGAAALPVAVALVAVAAGLLASRGARAAGPRGGHRSTPATATLGVPHLSAGVALPVILGALISLTGVSVQASAPILLAETVGATDPLLGYAVAAYAAAGALGGIALALWTRHIRLKVVVFSAVAIGTAAALVLPHVAPRLVPAVLLAAGVGLSGTLPLLVTLARRPGETSAAPAVARILGLAAGLGGVGYAGIGALQVAFGYTAALTLTAVIAGGAGLILSTRLRDEDADPTISLQAAFNACTCGGCGVATCGLDGPACSTCGLSPAEGMCACDHNSRREG